MSEISGWNVFKDAALIIHVHESEYAIRPMQWCSYIICLFEYIW